MRTHNICLYKKVNKKYTGCNKTMEFHECALIGVCAVIRSNTVLCFQGDIRKISVHNKCLDQQIWKSSLLGKSLPTIERLPNKN